MAEITMRGTVDVDDLAVQFAREWDRDDLLRLMRVIDDTTADWDFSRQIVEWAREIERAALREGIAMPEGV